MSKYRKQLPQLSGGLFLTDGGIETTLIFHEGLELPHFAAFHLLREKAGREALARYYERYMTIAKADGVGFILESPTWRASTDWGDKLGYTREEIAAANRESIRLMLDLRAKHDATSEPIVVSGCVGPRGDGYDPGQVMSAAEAETYHTHQIGALAEAGADMVTAITMTNASEAIGVAKAAVKAASSRRHLVHARDRWPSADRPNAVGRDRRGRCCNGGRTRLLHDQLRPSAAFPRYAANGAELGEAHSRHPRECITAQPSGAERGAGSRCRRSHRAWRPVS